MNFFPKSILQTREDILSEKENKTINCSFILNFNDFEMLVSTYFLSFRCVLLSFLQNQ